MKIDEKNRIIDGAKRAYLSYRNAENTYQATHNSRTAFAARDAFIVYVKALNLMLNLYRNADEAE